MKMLAYSSLVCVGLALSSTAFACARLSRPCLPGIVPAFPQRSSPRLWTEATCGGLRSAPDRRTRRAVRLARKLVEAVRISRLCRIHFDNIKVVDLVLHHQSNRFGPQDPGVVAA
jgi:hypothetical protein